MKIFELENDRRPIICFEPNKARRSRPLRQMGSPPAAPPARPGVRAVVAPPIAVRVNIGASRKAETARAGSRQA